MILQALVTVALSVGSPQAETAWSVTRTPTTIIAETELAGGDLIEARCEAGTLSLHLIDHGRLPSRGSSYRSDSDERTPIGGWVRLKADGPLLSLTPAITVRGLLNLPSYRVQFKASGSTPATPVEGDLPTDDAPLREVLAACNQPLRSDRDHAAAEVRARMVALQPGELPRFTRVNPAFPERAQAAGYDSGIVTVSCVMADETSIRDCQLESEFPAGVGFGEATLAAYARIRVDKGVTGAIFFQTVIFTTTLSTPSPEEQSSGMRGTY